MKISPTEARQKFGITQHWLRKNRIAGVDIGYSKEGRRSFYDGEKILIALGYMNHKQIAEKYQTTISVAHTKLSNIIKISEMAMRIKDKIQIGRKKYYRKRIVELAFHGFVKGRKQVDLIGHAGKNPRMWDCLRYDKCLADAAKQGVDLECGCPDYQIDGGLAWG